MLSPVRKNSLRVAEASSTLNLYVLCQICISDSSVVEYNDPTIEATNTRLLRDNVITIDGTADRKEVCKIGSHAGECLVASN